MGLSGLEDAREDILRSGVTTRKGEVAVSIFILVKCVENLLLACDDATESPEFLRNEDRGLCCGGAGAAAADLNTFFFSPG